MSILDDIKEALGIKRVSVSDATNAAIRHQKAPVAVSSSPSSAIHETDSYKAIKSLILNGETLTFVYGRAGSGKSTLIQYLLDNVEKRTAVVAPTGIAALNAGGATIHSFFRFPPALITKQDVKQFRGRVQRQLFRHLELLIIDEVSMVRADLMEGVCQSLGLNCGSTNKAFGGCQVLLLGDLFQLPPVVAGREEQEFIQRNYRSPWFFCANSLQNQEMAPVELRESFRQKDIGWLRVLDDIRCGRNLDSAVQRINEACANRSPTSGALILTCTRARANAINNHNLAALASESATYTGQFEGSFKKLEDSKLPAPFELELKVGARAMFNKNDSAKRWVNGTTGTVVSLGSDEIVVKLDPAFGGSQVTTIRAKWDKYRYEYDGQTEELERHVVGSYIQFPLQLAWAITIHKAQGLTLPSIHVDFGSRAFATGQVYVALSRCRSLENVTLERPLKHNDVLVDPEASRFYSAISGA